jgi:Peptidase family M23
LRKSKFIFIGLLLLQLPILAQHQYGWIWPLKRDIRLTGNYGELRPNHFHAGLDMATGDDHIPVVAIADGYLYRVESSTYGYGNAVHIAHANNFTSLYAHLYRYGKRVQSYVDSIRYNYQMYELDCYTGNDSVFIKQGDTIGYSGNTGASMGSHLHFEIRHTGDEVPLNPLRFFNLYDHVKPVINSVVLVPMTNTNEINEQAAYVSLNYEMISKQHKSKRKLTGKSRSSKKNAYAKASANKTKKRKGGFDDAYLLCDANAYELMLTDEAAGHTLLKVKSKKKRQVKPSKKRSSKKKKVIVKKSVVKSNLGDKIASDGKDLEDTVNVDSMLSSADKLKTPNVVRVPQSFGLQLSTYDSDLGGSANNIYGIDLYLDSILDVSIRMDSMSFDDLRYINTYLDLSGKSSGKMQRLFKTKNNALPIFKVINNKGIITLMDTNIHSIRIEVKDIKGNLAQFSRNIQWNGVLAGSVLTSHSWDCNKVNVYESNELIVGTDAKTFYQDINPEIAETFVERILLSKAFRVFTDKTLLHKWTSISIQPFEVVDSLKQKLCLVSIAGKSVSYVPSDYYQGKVSALVRKSGIYGVLLDTVAPKAEAQFSLIKMKGSVLKFKVSDNLSGIKQFKLFLNGKYVQAHHESKVASVFYILSDEEKANLETVKFEIIDNKSNKREFSLKK